MVSARFLVRFATAVAQPDGKVARDITMFAVESDGKLGPELHLSALDEETFDFFARLQSDPRQPEVVMTAAVGTTLYQGGKPRQRRRRP